MKLRSAFIFLAAACACSCGVMRQSEYYVEPENEVVELGYGSVTRDHNAYGVSTMEISSSDKTRYSDIFDYIRGRVPGVTVYPAKVGSMPKVVIRGQGSLNAATDPLYIVDGMETNDITYLNPYDVASINVLKDSAASIYGVRGANGVIIINTMTAQDVMKAQAMERRAMIQAARAERKQKRSAGKTD